MEADTYRAVLYMDFHPDHWTKISATNPLERLKGEIKRRTDVVAIFPNDAATAHSSFC
ncbi:transposase-like protein [Azospirillum canadense]|nr:transposase-like protein [Azospirillum canadense]